MTIHAPPEEVPRPIPKAGLLGASSLAAPPSKSATNRALVIAALAPGPSHLLRPLRSEDTIVLQRAIAALGVGVEDRGEGVIVVDGRGGQLSAPREPLDVAASGTALRFLTALATLAPGTVTITGRPRLRERPMGELVVALRRLGVEIEARGPRGRPPIVLQGGGFPGGRAKVGASTSSQFVSALLLVGPFGAGDLELELAGEAVSEPYIGLTCDLMGRFGVEVEHPDPGRYRVRAGSGYVAREYAVEADASSASYFFALGALLGQAVTVSGLDPASVQGDLRLLELLAAMGCRVDREPGGITVTGGELRGIDVDMSQIPDMVPTMAVLGAWAEGRTRIGNVANLRQKESDRLRALATELTRAGAEVVESRDGLAIEPGRIRTAGPATIATYADHRIAMSFAVLGAARGGLAVADPGCVAKSYPGFWSDLGRVLGVTWGPSSR